MNRQIKFRGKSKTTGEWVYGDLHLISKVPHIHIDYGYRVIIDVDTIGQFTGLLDANKKEIYEGDIVDFGLNAVVKYHPFLCSFVLDCDNKELHSNDSYSELGYMKKQCEKFVVIGNIHDNPELIKK